MNITQLVNDAIDGKIEKIKPLFDNFSENKRYISTVLENAIENNSNDIAIFLLEEAEKRGMNLAEDSLVDAAGCNPYIVEYLLKKHKFDLETIMEACEWAANSVCVGTIKILFPLCKSKKMYKIILENLSIENSEDEIFSILYFLISFTEYLDTEIIYKIVSLGNDDIVCLFINLFGKEKLDREELLKNATKSGNFLTVKYIAENFYSS